MDFPETLSKKLASFPNVSYYLRIETRRLAVQMIPSSFSFFALCFSFISLWRLN